MTYPLRRLRLHGIIGRILKTDHYRLTNLGLRAAWFCTRIYSRILRPGLGAMPGLSPPKPTLRRCFDKLDQEVTSWIEQAGD